jgi:hypothetical protein
MGWYGGADCGCCLVCEDCDAGTTPSEIDLTISGINDSNCTVCEGLNATFTLTQNTSNACLWEFEDTVDYGACGDPTYCESLDLYIRATIVENILGTGLRWLVEIILTRPGNTDSVQYIGPLETGSGIDCSATETSFTYYTGAGNTACQVNQNTLSFTLDPQ